MDDGVLVRFLKRLGDLASNSERFIDWECAFGESICKRFAWHQLHHKEPNPARLLKAMDGCDTGVIKRRENVGFALELGEALLVLREVVGQHLYSNVPPQLGVACAVDDTHPTGTDLLDQRVVE
jgi:hypothetical protein